MDGSTDGSGGVFSAAPPLTIDSCILSLSWPTNDSDVDTNQTAVGGLPASKGDLCADLLSSLVRPTHDPHRHARQMLTFLLMGVGGITLACFGLLGNLLSAVVLTRKTMTTSTYCYLAALSICDLLVVAFTLVLLIKDARYPEPESTSWQLSGQGSFYPYVFPYLHPAAITVQVTSVWLTLAFTVDRYIMICHPYKSEPFCTVSRARKIIASLVVASVVFNLPKFFEYRTVVVRPPLAAIQLSAVDDVAVVGCDLTEFGNSRAFKQLYHSSLYIVFVFGIPFISLVVLNAFLVDAVRKARQRSSQFRPSNCRSVANHDHATSPAYQLEDVPPAACRSAGKIQYSGRRHTLSTNGGPCGLMTSSRLNGTTCPTNGELSGRSSTSSLIGSPHHDETTYQLEDLMFRPRHSSETTSQTNTAPSLRRSTRRLLSFAHGSLLDFPRQSETTSSANGRIVPRTLAAYCPSAVSGTAGYQLEDLATAVPRSPSPVTRRIDTTVMLIGVVVIFIVCQFPALVSRTIWAFVDHPSRAFTDLPLYSLNETANFLVLLNSSVNIVPYYFFGRRFRRQFLKLFCPRCKRIRRQASTTRDRCDSAVDSAILFNHSAIHHRDSTGNQH